MTLKKLQSQLFKAITLQKEEDKALQLIEDKGSMSSADRLGIYQFAYKERLKECIEDDFQMSCKLLGETPFKELFDHFCSTQLSSHWNINAFNILWHDFVQQSSCEESIKELCHFEWLKVESFFKHYRKETPLYNIITLSEEHNARVRMDDSVILKKFNYSVLESERDETSLVKKEQNNLIWTNKFLCDAITLTDIEYLLAKSFLKQQSLDQIISDMSNLGIDDQILAETFQNTVSTFMEKRILLQV